MTNNTPTPQQAAGTLASSLIRTYVPMVVSALAGWLITLGVELNDDTQAALAIGLGGLIGAVYYALVRLIERRWPAFSALLGSSAQPDAYTRGAPEK